MLEHLVRLRQRLVGLSITYPRVVVGATLLLTVAFGLQFPKIRIDTDPKNMLPRPPRSGDSTTRSRAGSVCTPT